MRGISDFIAMLIVVGIVIGGALVANYIVSNLLTMQRPSGSDVVGRLFWLWEKVNSSSYVIYVHGPVSNVGNEIVNITAIEISYGGKKYAAEFANMKLHPLEWNELFAKSFVDVLPPTSTVSVLIYYCTPSRCSTSVISANVRSAEYLSSYEVITVTVPVATITQIVTTTVPRSTTVTQTVTTTQTVARTTTQTVTQTQTVTTTTTTTATTTYTVTRPAWPIRFVACYTKDQFVVVNGWVDSPLQNVSYIPYVVKYFKCGLLSCDLVAIEGFIWFGPTVFVSNFGLISPPPFGYLKVEVWSVDQGGQLIEKIWESKVDKLCATP